MIIHLVSVDAVACLVLQLNLQVHGAQVHELPWPCPRTDVLVGNADHPLALAQRNVHVAVVINSQLRVDIGQLHCGAAQLESTGRVCVCAVQLVIRVRAVVFVKEFDENAAGRFARTKELASDARRLGSEGGTGLGGIQKAEQQGEDEQNQMKIG